MATFYSGFYLLIVSVVNAKDMFFMMIQSNQKYIYTCIPKYLHEWFILYRMKQNTPVREIDWIGLNQSLEALIHIQISIDVF